MNSRAEQDYLAYKTCDEFPAAHIQCFGLSGGDLCLEPVFSFCKAANAASSGHAGLFAPSLSLAVIMHRDEHFILSDWRSRVDDRSGWIGVRQLAVQRV
jgi:hypothetical protein